eukprot:404431_1
MAACLVVITLLVMITSSQKLLPQQKSALNHIYNSLNITSYCQWNTTLDANLTYYNHNCGYIGTSNRKFNETNTTYQVVDKLILDFSLMGGAFPSSICNLTYLAHLKISFTHIHGTVPNCLFEKLLHLHHIILEYNSLNGTIKSFGNLKRLKHLEIVEEINISLSAVAALSELYYLHLGYDVIAMDGSIPDKLCDLHNLTYISFEYVDNIHGSIPNCLFQNKNNLTEWFLYGTNLMGSIPHSICDCDTLQSIFFVDTVNIHGIIPHCLKELNELQMLTISNTSLIGPFPSLCNNTKLNWIYITHNEYLNSSIPSCPHNNFPYLKTVQIFRNPLLSDHLPSYFFCGKSLDFLNMGSNGQQQHTLPECMSESTNISMINLCCDFHGTLPSMVNYTRLKFLDIGNNEFTGTPLQRTSVTIPKKK